MSKYQRDVKITNKVHVLETDVSEFPPTPLPEEPRPDEGVRDED